MAIVSSSALSIRDRTCLLIDLARQLNQVTDISTVVNQTAERSKQVVSMYKEVFEVQGNDLLEIKEKLLLISEPKQVDIQHLKNGLDKFKTALCKATIEMKKLESRVHLAIGDCAVEQKQHDKVIKKEESVIKNREIELAQYKIKMEECSKKAAESEKEAENCRSKARDMEETKKVAGLFAAGEGVAIGLVSLCLAPISGGASVLAGTAALAVTGGGLAAVDALHRKEKLCDSIAREERDKANEARNKMSQIEKEINTCNSKITISRDRIRTLQNTARTLDELQSCLLSFITVMNRVEVSVQDLETSMQGAVDFGSAFSIIQLTLSECPIEFKDIATEGLLELKSTWKAVEDEIRKMINI